MDSPQHVDDLAGLGVTCIWLMPFYPSADQDDGYDVSDYYAIDPRLGTFGDFTEFMAVARDRGLRVIADLVVNHTSDQHPWFQAASRRPRVPVPRFLRLAGRDSQRRPARSGVPG